MEVRTGRAAGTADATNCLPSSDRIAWLDGGRGQMGVAGLDAVRVFDHHHQPVRAAFARERHLAGRGGRHLGAVGGAEVDAVMKLAAAAEWIVAPPERGGRSGSSGMGALLVPLPPPPLPQEGGNFILLDGHWPWPGFADRSFRRATGLRGGAFVPARSRHRPRRPWAPKWKPLSLGRGAGVREALRAASTPAARRGLSARRRPPYPSPPSRSAARSPCSRPMPPCFAR